MKLIYIEPATGSDIKAAHEMVTNRMGTYSPSGYLANVFIEREQPELDEVLKHGTITIHGHKFRIEGLKRYNWELSDGRRGVHYAPNEALWRAAHRHLTGVHAPVIYTYVWEAKP